MIAASLLVSLLASSTQIAAAFGAGARDGTSLTTVELRGDLSLEDVDLGFRIPFVATPWEDSFIPPGEWDEASDFGRFIDHVSVRRDATEGPSAELGRLAQLRFGREALVSMLASGLVLEHHRTPLWARWREDWFEVELGGGDVLGPEVWALAARARPLAPAYGGVFAEGWEAGAVGALDVGTGLAVGGLTQALRFTMERGAWAELYAEGYAAAAHGAGVHSGFRFGVEDGGLFAQAVMEVIWAGAGYEPQPFGPLYPVARLGVPGAAPLDQAMHDLPERTGLRGMGEVRTGRVHLVASLLDLEGADNTRLALLAALRIGSHLDVGLGYAHDHLGVAEDLVRRPGFATWAEAVVHLSDWAALDLQGRHAFIMQDTALVPAWEALGSLVLTVTDES